MSDYRAFLETKRLAAAPSGFTADPATINPHLFPWQRAIVLWALERGNAALFTDTGTGKTRMQLAWAEAVADHTGDDVLILAPLAVTHQTAREGAACAANWIAGIWRQGLQIEVLVWYNS